MECVDKVFWKKGVFKDYGIGRDEYLMVKWWEMLRITASVPMRSSFTVHGKYVKGNVSTAKCQNHGVSKGSQS